MKKDNIIKIGRYWINLDNVCFANRIGDSSLRIIFNTKGSEGAVSIDLIGKEADAMEKWFEHIAVRAVTRLTNQQGSGTI